MFKKTESRREFLKTAGMGALGLASFSAPAALLAHGDSDIRVKEIATYIQPDAFFVRVTADNGLSGWGECDAGAHQVMEAFIHSKFAEDVVGRDPFQTGPILNDMFYGNHDFGPGGALANAISGVDIALWDLNARILEMPIYKLLGGRCRDRVPVYGSYGTGRWTKMTAKEAADQAEKFLKRGFRTTKCRMQVRESHLNPVEDQTVKYVSTIKKRVGDDIELFVDINNGYSANHAIQIGRILQDEYGMRFYEEPCSDQNHIETARVVEALDMGVIAGEKEYTPWQLSELIQYANPDYLNPDVIKALGITGIHRIAQLATVHHKPMILHNTRPTISTAASIQLAASLPIIGPFMEYMDTDRFPDQLATMDVAPVFEDGHVLVPDSPGLGIEVNEEMGRARSSSVKTHTG